MGYPIKSHTENNNIFIPERFSEKHYSALDKFSEDQIWLKFKNGEKLAFTYIYSKYVNSLYNFGCQFTDDKDKVKDCIHDMFIRLRRPGKSVKILSIKSYLYKCLYRDLIKMVTNEKRMVVKEVIENSFKVSLSPEQKLINEQLDKEKKQQLERSLDQLSMKQRQSLMLYFYEDLTYKEIAEIFDMRQVKTARKLIYRAIDSLRSMVRVK